MARGGVERRLWVVRPVWRQGRRLRGLTWQEYQVEMAIPVAGTAERLLLKTQRFIRRSLEALREAGFAPPAG